jgi:hypothetical protein
MTFDNNKSFLMKRRVGSSWTMKWKEAEESLVYEKGIIVRIKLGC